MILSAIILLVVVIVGLIIFNLRLYNRIKKLNNINDRINNLNVLQDFINTIGNDISAEEKIKRINDILIEKFGIKYSTIVVFNGTEYIVKSSNVSQKHWDTLKNLHNEELFKDSIMTATPKYVTVDSADEKLSYQKTEMGRAKSAIFFPLYIDNIYIGYWVIESSEMHAFDTLDTSVLGTITENIISVLKGITYQKTIEGIQRIDKTTGISTAEYLYGEGKRKIDEYASSTICMLTIINIEEINKIFGRNVGTQTIIKTANLIKTSISDNYILVRYMGPKFVIVFSGVEKDDVTEFVANLKEQLENVKVAKKEVLIKKKKKVVVAKPKYNFVLGTYYKGTGLEEVTKKLEDYLDNADKKESNINCE